MSNLTGYFQYDLPFEYLYFKNLAANKNQFKIKELAHFILPISLCFAIVILDKILPKSIRLDFIIFPFFCLYTITYFILSYRVLKNEIWNRKSSLNDLSDMFGNMSSAIFLMQRSIMELLLDINN